MISRMGENNNSKWSGGTGIYVVAACDDLGE